MATAIQQKPEWWPRTLLDEQPAADLLGLPVVTLRDWRCRKTHGLPYLKLGSRVKYNPDAVWKWCCANTVGTAVN